MGLYLSYEKYANLHIAVLFEHLKLILWYTVRTGASNAT